MVKFPTEELGAMLKAWPTLVLARSQTLEPAKAPSGQWQAERGQGCRAADAQEAEGQQRDTAGQWVEKGEHGTRPEPRVDG